MSISLLLFYPTLQVAYKKDAKANLHYTTVVDRPDIKKATQAARLISDVIIKQMHKNTVRVKDLKVSTQRQKLAYALFASEVLTSVCTCFCFYKSHCVQACFSLPQLARNRCRHTLIMYNVSLLCQYLDLLIKEWQIRSVNGCYTKQ